MEIDYKKKLYKNYKSLHTSYFGENSLEKTRKVFPVWNYYFKKLLPKNKEIKVLDIGCGQGGFVFWLKESGYKDSIGIDISEEQIETGKQIGFANIYQADLNTFLDSNLNSFDIIIARDVLEHFKKEQVISILDKIYKSLKNHGQLILQVPNGQGLFSGRIYYGDFTHETMFSCSSISQITRNAGYSKVSFYPTNPAPVNINGIIRSIIWKSFTIGIRLLQFAETGNSSGIFTQNLIAKIEKK